MGGVVGAVVSVVGGALANKIMGGKPKSDPSVMAAQRRQSALIKQQEAVQLRSAQEANRREEELSGQLASQRRASAARRRGRGSLAYVGPAAGLKDSLGG